MKTDILITDICLLGKRAEQSIIENCCLAISGDSITHIGPAADLSDVKARTIVNGHNQLAMPGLINTHCHGAMTLFRGLADDMELAQWLNEHIFPAEAANVNPDMVYWCTKLAAAEMILSGTTTVADGYFFEHDAARAFADAGLRAVAAQGIIDFPAPGVPDPTNNISAAGEFIDHWQKRNPLITPAVFAHSPYTCSGATLQKAKELARSQKVPLFIHVAESRFEADMITEMQGGSPIRHLDALGILDPATICVHCVWADEEDLVVLAESGAGVVVCPQSHLKLASGISPLESMLKKGIPVGLGTDGAASNNSLDMFREMDICAKIQKIRFLDPVAVPAAEILAMATTGGASVLGMETTIGALTAGKKADIILINLDTPHLQPMHGTDLLVYAAGGADVQTVLINGRLVMQDRKILSFDLAETLHQVHLLADRIKLQH
ncbi:MAG: amidohydrolase [Thermodesulfobacteriota bacterium]|nr:amidohydrolase [Thermodesulfobacteriota bacterium]